MVLPVNYSDARPEEPDANLARPSWGLLDFNKQIIVGEISALVGVPLAPSITARFNTNPSIIALSAILGGMLAGSIGWLAIRIRDERICGKKSVLNLASEIAFFSPAAFLLGLLVYQPTLFLIARHLLREGGHVVQSALLSQSAAFASFLVAINLYRIALRRFAGKRI